MGISDELAAIAQGPGGARAKQLARFARKADAVGAALAGKRFTCRGVRWTLLEAGTVEQGGVPMLRVVATARDAKTGEWLLRANDPRQPLFCINPPVMVADGTTDAAGNPNYREDPVEAGKQWLSGVIRRA